MLTMTQTQPALQFIVSEPATPRLSAWADYYAIESPVDWRWNLTTKRWELEEAPLQEVIDAALCDDPLTYTAALQVLRRLDMDDFNRGSLEWYRDQVGEFERIARRQLRKNPNNEQARRLWKRALVVYDLLDEPFQR